MCRGAAQGRSQHRRVRTENRELRHELLGFTARRSGIEQSALRPAPGRCRDEFDNRLVRNARAPRGHAVAKNLSRDPLPIRESAIVTIDQYVGVKNDPHPPHSPHR